ncbi:MAG TPA: hypothetical protein VHO69_11115 [Phototrophicaceae bacterium]|nr:hypothetical protein [Phototrophicaceae bacterium]
MSILWKSGSVVALLLSLSACQVFQTTDVQATRQAENSLYVAEATAIAQTAQAHRDTIQVTVAAADTQVAEVNSVNQQLLATVRALVPPTPQRIVGNAPEVSGDFTAPEVIGTPLGESGAGGSNFINTVVSASVRASDGCPTSAQTQFSINTPEIYVNTQALSISAGTVMRVEWFYDGGVVLEDSWTIATAATNFCLWYFITPDDVTFQAGQWAVRLSANGTAIEPEVTFVMTE